MSFFVLALMIFGHLQFLEVASYALPDASNSTIDSSPSAERSHRLTRDTAAGVYTYTSSVGTYKLHQTANTWDRAGQICEQEGGYLAVMNSQTEVDGIEPMWSAARPHFGSYDDNHVLLGFHDMYREGQHVTIQGESLAEAGFSKWFRNEPSGSNSAGEKEDCGAILFNFPERGYLNDVSCYRNFAFLCEQSRQNENARRITTPRYSATTTTTTAMPELDPEDSISISAQ